MKKILILLTVLCLCGCSVTATHSASVTTSVTNDGVTTTTETKIEDGAVSTDTFTTSEDDPTGLRNKWLELFTNGAEGVSEDGCDVYFIYNNSDSDSSLAAIMVTDGETGELLVYDLGEIEEEEDHLVINDVEGKRYIPFTLDQGDEGGFTIYFQDGDSAYLEYVELEDIIDHMISIWEVQGADFQAKQENEG